MTVAYWCVFVSIFIPIGLVGYAKFSGNSRYDNHAPRDFLEKQSSAQKRAYWAQLNTYEAFPPFAIGVVIAHQIGVEQFAINVASIIFVLARLAYGVCYIKDLATARSIIFGIGFVAMASLYIMAAIA